MKRILIYSLCLVAFLGTSANLNAQKSVSSLLKEHHPMLNVSCFTSGDSIDLKHNSINGRRNTEFYNEISSHIDQLEKEGKINPQNDTILIYGSFAALVANQKIDELIIRSNQGWFLMNSSNVGQFQQFKEFSDVLDVIRQFYSETQIASEILFIDAACTADDFMHWIYEVCDPIEAELASEFIVRIIIKDNQIVSDDYYNYDPIMFSEEDYQFLKAGISAFHVHENAATFNGKHRDSFVSWINKNLEYPNEAKGKGIEGTVVVQFVVDADGTVSNVAVKESVYPALDEEAVRVVSMSPKWEPAVQMIHEAGITAVPSTYTFPVIFKLKGKNKLKR